MKTTYYKRVRAHETGDCQKCDLAFTPDCMKLFDSRRFDYFLAYCEIGKQYKEVEHLTVEQKSRATILRSENEVKSNS